ncbi:FMN-binding protein [Pseudonocardia sp.]|uniref:FMN-binding protein n=1 Tax=Pseudonocardia sp. TaxID=60912 RepID=UPI0031FD7019
MVNGSPADTEFGPVQVQLNVSSGRIVSATAINYPQESGHDLRINSYAIPVLQQETVSAQNAQIDTVSGATVTSNGYRQSLQSALDAAHLGS